MDELTRFGHGGETNLNGYAVVFVLAAIFLTFVLPRRYIVVPMFFATFFIPLGQRVVFAGLHFMMFRVIILFGWLRLIVGGFSAGQDSPRFRLNTIDKALILWTVASVITFTLLWGEWEAFVNRMGLLYNTFGVYFLLRFLYHDEKDVDRTIRVFAIICAVVALFMLNEQVTGRNLFSVFGGVPEYTPVREGHLRSQAAFAHSILAGTFGATLLPLFVGLWWNGKSRMTAALGVISATVVTITSASSTPLLAYVAAVIGLCMWPLRKHMRLIRWGIVLSLIGLHLVMKAPVWALIARVDLLGGSSSDHRYQLINQFLGHFGEWWLLGTKNNGQWGWDMWDTVNWYVAEGINGGLLTFILFIAILVYGFKRLGIARRASEGDLRNERYQWSLGAALFSNVVAFFGVGYFDQMIVAWYSLLAVISTSTIVSDQALATSAKLIPAPYTATAAKSPWSAAYQRPMRTWKQQVCAPWSRKS